MKWFNTMSHNRWLEQETDRIFNFGKNAAVPTGFGWLGNKGQVKEEMGTPVDHRPHAARLFRRRSDGQTGRLQPGRSRY